MRIAAGRNFRNAAAFKKKKKKKKNWKLRRNISFSVKMADPPAQSSLIEFDEIFFKKNFQKFSNLAPQKESASHVTSRQAAYLLVLAHQRQTRTRRACHQVNPIQFGRHFVSSAGRSARALIGHFQPKTTDRHSEKQKNPTRPSPHGVSKTTDQVNKDGGISSTWKGAGGGPPTGAICWPEPQRLRQQFLVINFCFFFGGEI